MNSPRRRACQSTESALQPVVMLQNAYYCEHYLPYPHSLIAVIAIPGKVASLLSSTYTAV